MKNSKQPFGLLLTVILLFFTLPDHLFAQGDCTQTGLTNPGLEWGEPNGTFNFYPNSNGWTSENFGFIEVWGTGHNGIPAYEGSNFVELNSNGYDNIYQDISTTPGASYNWQIVHRGRQGIDVANLEFGPPAGPSVVIQNMTDGIGAWTLYTGTYIVPAGQTTTRIRLVSVSVAGPCISCGNLVDAFNFTAVDSDGDGVADCNDGCPSDPLKSQPGQCGCGFADTDSDGDGTADCKDLCPGDATKIAPGICGCGVADTDSDGDGVADCHDGCPNDAGKTAPGICGCGVADTDSDGDGIADCKDECPTDPDKILAGQCGCGNEDTDSDCDGVADCNDVCPGGDDSVDNNNDLLPDCKYPPSYNDISANWKCGKNKVYVCHIPPGNPGNAHTICVSYAALSAHIGHGDYLGPCGNASCDDPIKSNGGNHFIIGEAHNHSHDAGEGVHENQELNFNVLPNPNHGDFIIELNQRIPTGSVHIYNSIGSEVWSRSIGESTDRISIRNEDLGFSSHGVFHVVIRNTESKVVKSVLILE